MTVRSRGIESLREYLRKAHGYYSPEGTQKEPAAEIETNTEAASIVPGSAEAIGSGAEAGGALTAGSPSSAGEPEAAPSSLGAQSPAEGRPRSGSDPHAIEHEATSSDDVQVSPTDVTGAVDMGEAWEEACRCFSEGHTVTGLVTGCNRGGLLVRWGELQGFVPASQMGETLSFDDEADRETQLMRRVGEELQLRIIELDPTRNRLVLSERALVWGPEQADHLLESIHTGETRHGRVSNLCNFGAFVDLGGVDGLIHVSELAWRRVSHPSEVLEVGQEIDVSVLDVDRERRRIALSLKRLKNDPWLAVDRKYRVGQLVRGTITNVVSFGAFARIEDGLEGLIHISELGEGNIFHPRNVVQEGEVLSLRILRIDGAHRRIGLSLRQVSNADIGAGLPGQY